MNYRVYLLDADNKIKAAESFRATDDSKAEEVALALYNSCSASFPGTELWRGSARILRQTDPHAWPTMDLQKLLDKRQESLAQLEDVLERSFECVRQSRQFMSTLDKLRSVRSP